MKKSDRRIAGFLVFVAFTIAGVVLFIPPYLPKASPTALTVSNLILTNAGQTYTIPMAIDVSFGNATGGFISGAINASTPVTMVVTIAPVNPKNSQNITKIVTATSLTVDVNNSVLVQDSSAISLPMALNSTENNRSFGASAEAVVEFTKAGYWSGTFHFKGNMSGTEVGSDIPVTFTDLYIFPSSPPFLGGWGNAAAVAVVGVVVGALVYVLIPSDTRKKPSTGSTR